jgi:polyhydroxyalkanoate synthesis regulator phasin
MLSHHNKWYALLGTLTLAATAASAQTDSTLTDLLVKKGILTADDAKQVQAGATAAKADESSTEISGRIYFDFTNVDSKNKAGDKLDASGFGTDVKRFYFGVTHKFNSMWLININTDSSYSSSNGNVSTYIKTAYVQATLDPLAIIQVGSANMPWIPFDEDLYGFRYVESTVVDRLKLGNSADWGLHLLGKSGMFSYNVAAVNGGGYKKPARSKGVDYEGRVSIEPTKGLVFGLGAYTGKQGKDMETVAASNTANRLSLVGAYTTKKFGIGAEYFTEKNWGYTASTSKDKADGFSVFGNATIHGPFSVFARYDYAKPSKTLASSEKDNYFNVGLQYHAMKGVDIALVYKYEKIDNQPSSSAMAKYNEIGIFGQFKF